MYLGQDLAFSKRNCSINYNFFLHCFSIRIYEDGVEMSCLIKDINGLERAIKAYPCEVYSSLQTVSTKIMFAQDEAESIKNAVSSLPEDIQLELYFKYGDINV